MTVAAGLRSTNAGDGTTPTFTALFSAKNEADISVVLIDDSDLSIVEQVLNTDYTVAFVNSIPSVTFTTIPAVDFTVLIYPAAPLTQTADITNGGSLFGSSIEEGLDRNTINIQDLQDRIAMCIQVPRTDASVDALLGATARTDKYLYFNATTGQPEMRDLAVVQADLGMLDAGLAEIAALTPDNDDIIQTKAGAYASRSMAEVAVDLLVKVADGLVGTPSVAFADDTDTGLFRIAANKFALVTNGVSRLIVDADGNITLPSNSAFLAIANSDILNVTGDGTAYTMLFNTEVHDRGGDYVPATGIFTARATGLHDFSGAISLLSVGGITSILVELVTSNRTYQLINIAGADNVSGVTTLNWSMAGADMDAADTAFVRLTVGGGSLAVDIDGDAAPRTFFSGRLVA
jgi:hypothetical protein